MKLPTVVSVGLVLFVAGTTFGQNPHYYQGTDSTTWVAKLQSADAPDRQLAASALGHIAGQVQEEFRLESAKAAKVTPAGNRGPAVRRLSALTAPAGTIVPALEAAAARDTDATTRERARAALEKWQALVEDAVAFYRGRLRDDDFAPRMFAAESLGDIGPLAKDAVDDLQAATRDPEDRVRKAALAALTAIQRGAVPIGDASRIATVREMVKNLKHQKTSVRSQAAEGLGPVCQDDEGAAKIAVPALVDTLLADYDTAVRARAAESLGQIGPLAKVAVPALQRAARENRDMDVVKAAQEALKKIGE